MEMQDLDKMLEAGEVKIPDLDWLSLKTTDVDNIPSENPVEIIPQLQEAWAHDRKSTALIPNVPVKVREASDTYGTEAVKDVADTAKKQMMLGAAGKVLVEKLASLYPQSLIKKAKDELVKAAAEQGLLGNVYVDVSVFDTCHDAVKALGPNRIRTAKYVVGKPKRGMCSSHTAGYCKELKRKVVAEVIYDKELLDSYADHLRIAGALGNSETITSKDHLRECFLKKSGSFRDTMRHQMATEAVAEPTTEKVREAFAVELEKKSSEEHKREQKEYFQHVRPVLAFIQGEMLKGRIGRDLKEAIAQKYVSSDIAKYSNEIRKLASLQGLMGNVYVDVSYYKDAAEAIEVINAAKTKPPYVIQTAKKGQFDDTLMRVAKATGCSILPSDGKIDKEIALSYIDDLQFGGRISSTTATGLKHKVENDSNVLSIIRDAFVATQEHKREPREGGVLGFFGGGTRVKQANRDNIKSAVHKALSSGVALDQLEKKVASYLPTTEAVGLVRDVLSTMKEIDASSLTRCANEKYHLSNDAFLKKAAKCDDCVLNATSACTYLGVRFAGTKDPEKITIELDPKTDKVQYSENPDISREDMKGEMEPDVTFGSGMNIALGVMRGEDAPKAPKGKKTKE